MMRICVEVVGVISDLGQSLFGWTIGTVVLAFERSCPETLIL